MQCLCPIISSYNERSWRSEVHQLIWLSDDILLRQFVGSFQPECNLHPVTEQADRAKNKRKGWKGVTTHQHSLGKIALCSTLWGTNFRSGK
jgi:hypothetical protein